MSQVRIAAEPRTEFGKGAARRVRRSGLVPAVVYGHGTEPQHVALPGHDLMLALKTANVLLELQLDGAPVLALPKFVQRDAVKQTLEHVDLVIVRSGEKVVVEIPVTVVGKLLGAGLVELQQPALALEVEATHIPAEVVVDVEGMEIGGFVRAGEIPLPTGATLAADADSIVVAVLGAQAEPELEEEAPAADEVEAAETDEG